MGNATGLTRGDKRRGRQLTRLREVVTCHHAIAAIDLGEDLQMLVVTDHDSKVLARRVLRCKAFQLGDALRWAWQVAESAGFESLVVACEPTGSRWMQVRRLAAEQGYAFVCVQPLAVHSSRQCEDYTRHKSDYRDTVLIARLTSELRCYLPEQLDAEWAMLRHAARRRSQLLTAETAAQQQLRDLLSVACPGVLTAAANPFDAMAWLASMAVAVNRCDTSTAAFRRWGEARFITAVRSELGKWGGKVLRTPTVRAVFRVLNQDDGVVADQRKGALTRAGWVLEDLRETRNKITETERVMLAQLQVLGLRESMTTIAGLSPVSAAAILAETGDPAVFTSARSLVKLAGLNPGENSSATFTGATRITKRGRPQLRLAAWRAVWVMRHHNPVLAARLQHLTTRDNNRLTPGQAQTACAATLLRWIHAVATTGRAWDPDIASGLMSHTAVA